MDVYNHIYHYYFSVVNHDYHSLYPSPVHIWSKAVEKKEQLEIHSRMAESQQH